MIPKHKIANKLLSIRLEPCHDSERFWAWNAACLPVLFLNMSKVLRNPSKKALYQICNRYSIDPKDFDLPDKSPYLSKNKYSSNIDKNILNSLLEEIRKKMKESKS